MISIVCACNNRNILKEMLVKSLKRQTYQDYELIIVDTIEKKYKSASEALNYGADLAKGDLIVFTHQDIELIDNDVLERIVSYSAKYDYGIAGVAGVEYGNKTVYSSITHGVQKEIVGQLVSDVKEVFALDECFFIIKKENFKKFDEYNSWHFYAVEYSIRCKLCGNNVLLFPLEIYHLSMGKSLNKQYWITLKKIAKKYKQLKIIPTTFCQFKNSFLLNLQIFKLKRKLKKSLKC